MRLQRSELAVRSTGSTVSLLHLELELLDFQIPRRERDDGAFGEGTRRAVMEVQRELDLEPTGIVDRKTAKILNREVRRRTSGDVVLERLGDALREEERRVAAMEEAGDRGQAVGVRRRLDALTVAVEDLLDPDDEDRERDSERVRHAAEGLRARVDELIGAAGEEEEDNGGRIRIVEGRVVDNSRVGVPGLVVVAVDRDVARTERMGRGASGADGRYEIRYQHRRDRARGKGAPDLQIEVYGPADAEKPLARSDIRYDAGPRETLDVAIPEGRLDPEPEYRRLTRDLTPHMGAVAGQRRRLAELEESDGRRDVTYLANKTGWDARAVAMASLADRFGETTGVDGELLYALFRAGIPAEEKVLAGVGRDMVERVWKRAAEEAVISPEAADRIPENLERFDAFTVDRLLDQEPAAGGSPLGQLLEVSLGGDEEGARVFTELIAHHRGDREALWNEARRELGEETTERLRLDGQLAFLTVNNAPLISRIHDTAEPDSPVDLVRAGFYKEESWAELLDDDADVPAAIPGRDEEERRSNYADFMAHQLRLGYPTAAVAEMVDAGEMSLPAPDAQEGIYDFLSAHQGEFELGIHPVERYVGERNIELEESVVDQVKTLQRVYQITPSDGAMATLLDNGVDSSYAVLRYGEPEFVRLYGGKLGGDGPARRVYQKAQQVHNAALNVATDYLLRRRADPLFAVTGSDPASDFGGGDGAGGAGAGANGSGEAGGGAAEADVIAMPTLESLFGEMDFCACEHCRSVLSPAAYLVDLLTSIDLTRRNAAGDELPSDVEGENPLDVLLDRRPDIQHLALTCENTNTTLPYVDLVNEILEHFVVSGADDGEFSLEEFRGYDVAPGTRSEDLLANPHFVNDAAYEALEEARYPLNLPFHRSLALLRRYLDYFDVELHAAMEALRADDDLDRTGPEDYGWRDILMERLGITRREYVLLTDADVPLHELYGETTAEVTTEELRDRLSNARTLARTLDLEYEDLIRLVRTRFVNPDSSLISRLERLFVSLADIRDFQEGELEEAEFRDLLPEELDEAPYGGDAVQWVRDNFDRIMGLVVLSNPSGTEDVCSFEDLELRYANPDFDTNRLRPVEFRKLLRFVRLRRVLGWSIKQTDRAVLALYPPDQRPAPGDDDATVRDKLDAGFRTLVPRLAHALEVMELLELDPPSHLEHVLALWAPIDATGPGSLYRRMFLNPSVPGEGEVFREDGTGDVLDGSEFLVDHRDALRAAFDLTDQELSLVLEALGFDEETPLTLENVSAVFRRGFLARQLGTSVRELLGLLDISGLDPFSSPDPVRPDAVRFLELARRLRASSFTVSHVLYYLVHDDLAGGASPARNDVLDFARTLRRGLERIEQEHRVDDDPAGELTREKMALAYGSEATEAFFGLLRGTTLHSVAYDHGASELQDDIRDVTERLAYDDFAKRLSYRGLMTDAEKTALDAAPSATDAFRAALEGLQEAGVETSRELFERHPELRPLYEDYRNSTAPEAERLAALLEPFLPEIKGRLKRQHLRQTLAADLDTPLALVTTLLETPRVLHADGRPGEPVRADLLGLEAGGLSASFHFAPDASGDPDLEPADPVSDVRYGVAGSNLPDNPDPGEDVISAAWRGYLEAPDTGAFNFYVQVDTTASVSLSVEGAPVAMASENGEWSNEEPVDLRAGRFYALELTTERVAETVVLEWASRGVARGALPAHRLYPERTFERWAATYLRLLKAGDMAEALPLSEEEFEHFGAHADHRIDGEGWLNAIPTEPGATDPATSPALFQAFVALLRYRELREGLEGDGDRLVEVLAVPETETEDGDSLLERVTGWPADDLTTLFGRFGLVTADLSGLEAFTRVHDAFRVVEELGVGAETLLAVVTNDPAPAAVRRLEDALRARYSDEAWRKIVRSIHDELRGLQQDALVDFVLHQLGRDPDTQHIDTPEKLFEFFLVDVEMDACMLTSRVKQALSTTQLFIQRCLLNLEPRVDPESIDAGQWAWMKRYRIWEANRKVFLFPENWLEPELRDNKSPVFEDLESELLESDITEEAATTAFLHYLEKLDEVAKLEICGMYLEEGSSDAVHVVARTAGTRRRYYYRRLEHGSWTPWEPVGVDVEDRPVIPVVWRSRLFLFWLSLLQTGPDGQQSPTTASGDTDLTELTAGDLSGSVETEVEVTLFWSEYYNGKWQPPRSSDMDRPVTLGPFPATGSDTFNRRDLSLSTREDDAGALQVQVGYEDERYFQSPNRFTLYNTHSASVRAPDEAASGRVFLPIAFRKSRSFSLEDGPFVVTYYDPGLLWTGVWRVFSRTVLGTPGGHRIVQPHHQVGDTFTAPFFFQNSRHAFYVETDQETALVPTYPGFGLVDPPRVLDRVELPPVRERPVLDDLVIREELHADGQVIQPGVVDPAPVEHFLRKETSRIRTVFETGGGIRFGDRLVGPDESEAIDSAGHVR